MGDKELRLKITSVCSKIGIRHLETYVELTANYIQKMKSRGFKRIRFGNDRSSEFIIMAYKDKFRIDAFFDLLTRDQRRLFMVNTSVESMYVANFEIVNGRDGIFSYNVLQKKTNHYKRISNVKTLVEAFDCIYSLDADSEFVERWHAPSIQEISFENDMAISMSSITEAKTIGIVHLNRDGKAILNGLENPNTKPYFLTVTKDNKGRLIHFITGDDKSRFLVAEKFGTNIITCTSDTIFGGTFDISERITVTDLKIINLAVELWVQKHA